MNHIWQSYYAELMYKEENLWHVAKVQMNTVSNFSVKSSPRQRTSRFVYKLCSSSCDDQLFFGPNPASKGTVVHHCATPAVCSFISSFVCLSVCPPPHVKKTQLYYKSSSKNVVIWHKPGAQWYKTKNFPLLAQFSIFTNSCFHRGKSRILHYGQMNWLRPNLTANRHSDLFAQLNSNGQ